MSKEYIEKKFTIGSIKYRITINKYNFNVVLYVSQGQRAYYEGNTEIYKYICHINLDDTSNLTIPKELLAKIIQEVTNQKIKQAILNKGK